MCRQDLTVGVAAWASASSVDREETMSLKNQRDRCVH